MNTDGPVLRIFEVRTKPDCAAVLLKNFATTSAQVVSGKPGNRGFFFGRFDQRHQFLLRLLRRTTVFGVDPIPATAKAA